MDEAGFSPSDAALEGFKILRRHWRAVAGWSLFNLIALVALGIVGAVIAFGAQAAASAGALSFNPALGGLLASLGEAFITAIIAAGLFRLMLRPDEAGWMHLRIGADEVRILGVWILLSVAAFLLVGFCAVLIGAGRSLGPPGALAAAILVVALATWLSLRLSLSAVATFAEQRLAFDSSWRLTRGRGWRLFGMAILSGTVTLLIAVVVGLVVLLAMAFSVGLGGVMEAMFSAEGGEAHPGVRIAGFLAELVLFPAFSVLLLAPWVAAYRSFRGAS